MSGSKRTGGESQIRSSFASTLQPALVSATRASRRRSMRSRVGVCVCRRSTVRKTRLGTTSSPASTPRMPSKRPPVGCVSRWLPIAIGGRSSRRPRRRAKMLPISSTVTRQPSRSQASTNQSRTRRSSSLSVSRHTPPRSVAPIRPVSRIVCQRRVASISVVIRRISGPGRCGLQRAVSIFRFSSATRPGAGGTAQRATGISSRIRSWNRPTPTSSSERGPPE